MLRQGPDRRMVDERGGARRVGIELAVEDDEVRLAGQHRLQREAPIGGDAEIGGEVAIAGQPRQLVHQAALAGGAQVGLQHGGRRGRRSRSHELALPLAHRGDQLAALLTAAEGIGHARDQCLRLLERARPGQFQDRHAGRAHQPLDVGMRHRIENDEIGPEIEDEFGRRADGGNVARAIRQDRGAGIAREIADPDQLPGRGKAQRELIEAEVDGHDPSRGGSARAGLATAIKVPEQRQRADRHDDTDPGEATPPTDKTVSHALPCHPYMSDEQSRGWLHLFVPHGSGKRDVGSIGVPGGSGVKAGRRPPPEAARSGLDAASPALDWERREAAFGVLHREVGLLANARRLDGITLYPVGRRGAPHPNPSCTVEVLPRKR